MRDNAVPGVYTHQQCTLMNDQELHRLLRQHPASLPLPAAFEREVWARIEVVEVRSVTSLLGELVRRVLTSIGRPAVAFATIALFAATGAGTGAVMLNKGETARGELAYLKTVNPLVRPHAGVEP